MVRISGIELDTFVTYRSGEYGAELEVLVPSNISLTDEDIIKLKNAELIEEFEDNFGKIGDVIAEYSAVGWISVEKTPKGIFFRWQTYRTTDLEALKQDNEDLTQALLELAEIVGGNNG